jgi:hypothetical protein
MTRGKLLVLVLLALGAYLWVTGWADLADRVERAMQPETDHYRVGSRP